MHRHWKNCARRDETLCIAAARGVGNVRVFGSVTRRESRPGSDIDLVVDMEPGRTVLDLSELILDLEDALKRPVDVIEIRRRSPLVERILRGAIPL